MSIKALTDSKESFDGTNQRVLIIHARWNIPVIQGLLNGAKGALVQAGVKEENIIVESVPGSYELPFACARAIAASHVQASSTATDLLGSISLFDPMRPTTPVSQIKTSKPSTSPFSAVIAIGVLIKGSTMHFEYISEAVSQGLMRVQLDTGVPIIFGILTCLTEEQALERSGVNGGHNHGIDWGKAAVELGVKTRRWAEGGL